MVFFFGLRWGTTRWGATTRGLRGGNDIFAAAQHGKLGAVRHLLRTVPGAAAATGVLDRTALHVAALHGHAEMCRLLLAAGAAVDAREEDGLLAKDCDCRGAGDVSVEKHWQFLF